MAWYVETYRVRGALLPVKDLQRPRSGPSGSRGVELHDRARHGERRPEECDRGLPIIICHEQAVAAEVPASRSGSTVTIPTSREAVHPLQVSFERLQAWRDLDAGEFDVERQSLVPFPLPDVRVEGEEAVREVRSRGRDAVARHGETLRVHAPAVHGPPNLVAREGRDGREEAEEIPETRVERPSRAGVALVRAALHHLDVVRREEVPEEVPTPVRREEQVQVLVRPAARFDGPS